MGFTQTAGKGHATFAPSPGKATGTGTRQSGKTVAQIQAEARRRREAERKAREALRAKQSGQYIGGTIANSDQGFLD